MNAVTNTELDALLDRQIQAEQYLATNQSGQVLRAIKAIRAIHQLFPPDVAAICAALSSKLASDMNAHNKLHQVAVDGLDAIHDYIKENISEEV